MTPDKYVTQDAQKAVSRAPASDGDCYPSRLSSQSPEPLGKARTMHGKRRVSARRGWGEQGDFFSTLLEPRALFRNDQYLYRLIHATHIQLKSLPCLDLTEPFRFSLR